MLIIGHQHDVTFKVNVMGTSAEPQARLILGTFPELCFPATKSGEQWVAAVKIPSDMQAGTFTMRVEVIVNGRFFTPLVKQVELQSQDIPSVTAVLPAPVDEVPADPPTPESEVAPQPEPAPEPEPVSDTIDFKAEVPKQEEGQPAPETPRISIIQMIAGGDKKEEAVTVPDVEPIQEEVAIVAPPVAATRPKLEPVKIPPAKIELGSLKKVVVAESIAKPKRVVTPLPKPQETKPVAVKVKLGDIVKVAEKMEPRTEPTPAPRKPKPVVEMKQEIPVKLIKGEVIYE